MAWLGPVLVDIAAVAGAFMQLAVRHETVQWSGRLLLAASTGLSIVGNLARCPRSRSLRPSRAT